MYAWQYFKMHFATEIKLVFPDNAPDFALDDNPALGEMHSFHFFVGGLKPNRTFFVIKSF